MKQEPGRQFSLLGCIYSTFWQSPRADRLDKCLIVSMDQWNVIAYTTAFNQRSLMCWIDLKVFYDKSGCVHGQFKGKLYWF